MTMAFISDFLQRARMELAQQSIAHLPPQLEIGRYYCDGAGTDSPDCLQPRPLNEMQFGCMACGLGAWKPFGAWHAGAATAHFRNAGREKELEAIQKDPRIFVQARRFLCTHGLKIVARCPACQKVIDLTGSASPIAVVGGVHAGKSVLSGIFAHALSRRDADGLFARTGLTCVPRGSANRRYEADVVKPLVERGELPRKTWLDEYHKAIYQIEDLLGAGWVSRSLMLTDVAGEVYDEDVTPAITALRTILLWSRELVLLVDPTSSGAAGGMGGRQAPDLLEAAQRVVAEVVLPSGQIDAPHTGRVLAAIEAVSRALADSQWPSANVEDVADRVVVALACAGLGRGVEVPRIVSVLDAADRDRPRTLTNSEIASWLIQHIQVNADVTRVAGKLPYRVAVAVTKSELLEQELGPAWREPIRPAGRAGAADWARDLGRVSAWSKERLMGIGLVERELVSMLEEHFAGVGYFFVSSLGRDTDIRVRSGGVQPAGSTHEGYTGVNPSASSSNGSSVGPWWVTSKIVAEGEDGSRCPSPIGVLHPLLWLLCQGRGRSLGVR